MNDDGMDLPDFLRISAQDRAKAWEKNPPRPMPAFGGHELTETEKLYRESKERDKAIKRELDRPRLEALRVKAKAEKAERDALAATKKSWKSYKRALAKK